MEKDIEELMNSRTKWDSAFDEKETTSHTEDFHQYTDLPTFLTKEDFEQIEVLSKAIEKDDTTVTCIGLYNHGKSTLLNALIDDYKNETFATADARETTENKSVSKNNITYTDTPGLNATDEDDEKVMKAVKESDINLFVHNVSTGEFVASEVKFLDSIKNNWENPQEFIQRTIFILSRSDSADDEVVLKTQEKMQSQVVEIFNAKPKMLSISSLNYQKGMLENKQLLVKNSNVESLRVEIGKIEKENKDSILATRKERLESKYMEIIDRLNAEIKENNAMLKKLEAEESKMQQNLEEDIRNVNETLKNMYARM